MKILKENRIVKPSIKNCRHALLLGLALWLGLVSAPGTAQTEDKTTFNVMSYNIRYRNNSDGLDVWANRHVAVCETIQSSDVVGLQEVLSEQLDEIRSQTNGFEWYGLGREDGQRKGELAAIGWKSDQFEALEKGTFWLSDTPATVGSVGWDAALPRVATWAKLRHRTSQQSLLFVNTHFDHKGRVARKESAKLINDWCTQHRGDTPIILSGDLNATLNAPPLKQLLRNENPQALFLDARRSSRVADTGPNSTWNGFREIAEGRRIDYLLFHGDLVVEKFETLNPKTDQGRFASDHMPVRATFRF